MIIKIICFLSLSFTVPKKWVYAYLDTILRVLSSPLFILSLPCWVSKKLLYHLSGPNMFSFYLMDILLFFFCKKNTKVTAQYIFYVCIYILQVSKDFGREDEYVFCSYNFSVSKATVHILHWIWWFDTCLKYHMLVSLCNFNTLSLLLVMLYFVSRISVMINSMCKLEWL